MKAWVVIVSVCANLVLAGFAIHLHTRDSEQVTPPACVPTLQLLSSAPERSPVSPLHENDSAPFHWSSLESTNFEIYVANLRAVGCPESTVRDIVFGELEEIFSQKQLSGSNAAPFWLCGTERSAAEKRERLRCLELERDGREWVHQLLGSNIEPLLEDSDWVEDFQQYGIGRALLGPVPRETLVSVFALVKRFESAGSELRDGTGLILREDRDRIRRNLQEECENLQRLTSVELFSEFSVRCFALRFALKSHSDERFTGQEMRAIARMQAAAFGPESIFLEDLPLPDESEREREFEQSLRAYLGVDRYERYTRSKDGGYKQLLDLTQEQGQPQEIAIALSDTRRVLEEESSRIRADADISSRERRTLLSQMQTEVQAQAAALLGQAAYGQYLGQGGHWLTNAIELP